MPPVRLRIPPALAVAILGGAASVAMSFVACEQEPQPPEPIDASELPFERDAGDDGHVAASGDALALEELDGGADGGADGASIDARPDAAIPVDAPPPDTPVA